MSKRILKRNPWSDADVEKHWDNVAGIYVEENNKVKSTHDQRFAESVKDLKLTGRARVLNISSRDCEANDYIRKAQPDAEVINAEISLGLMQEANKIRPYVNQQKIGTYSELPFHDEQFNRILTLETLEHVHDPVSFLSELYRVSTPDARMVLSCPSNTNEAPYQVYTFIFGGHGEGPHRFPSPKEVKLVLKHTGWKLLQHRSTVLIPVGPRFLKNFGEKVISGLQGTFIANLGIRQFYICEKH